jgi:hypothetical protein
MLGLQPIRRVAAKAAAAVRSALAPASAGAVRGLLADLTRSRQELLAENAFLRQQLVVAARRVKRAHLYASDRALLVALAAAFSHWREALILVKPETLLRWHRQGFKLLWTWRSKKKSKPGTRLAKDVIDLIRTVATTNRLWGAERIRGELLKLGYTAAKSTIQRYLAGPRSGAKWPALVDVPANPGARDLVLRPARGARLLLPLSLRVRRDASGAEWLAQNLRHLAPFGNGPTSLIRDNDRKFGETFDAVAHGAGARVIRTPLMSPTANCNAPLRSSHC